MRERVATERYGKYELLNRIGRGGMAEVFLARQASAGRFERIVVIKRIRPKLANEQQFVDMFLEEARIAALLVERIDIGVDGLNVRLRVDGLTGLAREMMADLGTAA